MAYTPINWQNGDTITAEKMNKMDNGWSVTNGRTVLANETVTTEDDDGDNVAYLDIGSGVTITAETIDVTFDGTVYTCDKDGETYGGTGFDFSVYPFMLYNDGTLYTESAGTYTVKIETNMESTETTVEFGKAVNSCVEFPESGVFVINMNIFGGGTEKTWQEIRDAFTTGKICVVAGYGPVLQMWYAGDNNRYYMATGATNTNNLAFDPAIWITAGNDPALPLWFYKYNSQMP